MTLATKIIFIIALIVSIIVPFGYYLLGEKSKKRYKRAIGTNAFFFFGAFAVATIMLLGGPDVQAAEAVTADSGFRDRTRLSGGGTCYRALLYRRRYRGRKRGKRRSRGNQRRFQRTR